MAGLALSVAASCNFPVLAMAIFWRGTTTRGAVAGGLAGLVSAVVLVVLSRVVWVAVFKFAAAPFPYENPALFSMPLAFLFTWAFSVTDWSARGGREREAFDAQFIQSEIGLARADGSALAGAPS
jgi:cation/acetate symporter